MPNAYTPMDIENQTNSMSQSSSYTWKQWAKAGMVFAATLGTFAVAKSTGSFRSLSKWAFGDNSDLGQKNDALALGGKENQLLQQGRQLLAYKEEGAQELLSSAIAKKNRAEGLKLVEFNEEPINPKEERTIAKRSVFPAKIELSSLDGTTGFVLNGEEASDRSGYSVSGAGDVNGDGIDDLIMGAGWADPSGRSDAGKSYVIFGRNSTWSSPIELSSLDGRTGFVLNGEEDQDWSGWSVSGVGDVNGDNVADVIVGAYNASLSGRIDAGKSYVVFGHNGVWPASIELSSLDGATGFVINGESVDDRSGFSVSGAGDVNGDNVADVIVGANRADLSGRDEAGKSYVVFGHNGVWPSIIELSSLNGTTGFVLNGEEANDRSGISVSSAGDVNGDNIADVIVGAYYANPSGRYDAGKSYVVFGDNGVWPATIELSSLNGITGFILNGEGQFDRSGYSVSGAGDVNGDGIDDLIVGAGWADPLGRSYVIFGRNSTWSSPIELSSLDGTTGFVLNGEEANDRSGISVSSAGDVNGDNVADVIVGAFAASPSGRSDAGKSYVVFGHNGVWPSIIELSSLDGTTGFVLNGEEADDYSGYSVSGVGDVNGDNVADVIVGAYGADPSGRSLAGKSHIIFGRAEPVVSSSTSTSISSSPSSSTMSTTSSSASTSSSTSSLTSTLTSVSSSFSVADSGSTFVSNTNVEEDSGRGLMPNKVLLFGSVTVGLSMLGQTLFGSVYSNKKRRGEKKNVQLSAFSDGFFSSQKKSLCDCPIRESLQEEPMMISRFS